jgi:hypothetical protein
MAAPMASDAATISELARSSVVYEATTAMTTETTTSGRL